jgi:NAD(P)-dependent dehydrogenase (short-subunit alcohol dehydrogenase family)
MHHALVPRNTSNEHKEKKAMSVKDKVVIITGAGRGIGAATARLMASQGGRVVVADINEEGGTAVTDSITSAGGSAIYARVDVSDSTQMTGLVERAVKEYGRLDGIVNNAATIAVAEIENLSVEEWDRVMMVNGRGVFLGCKHAIIQFKKQGGGGSIVNIGSISAVVGLAQQPVYCASKGAVVQLTRQIAMEYAKENIRCNTVGPGSVDGEFFQMYLDGQGDADSALQAVLNAHPMGRVARPDEIAEAITFLISDNASFVTGSNLQVDGGYSAQ